MLTIVTGLPGASKTLHTLAELDKEYAGKREIYYYGIKELKLAGWYEFEDPRKWFDLPDASVIVIDEAQQPFPQRGLKDKPEWIERFETHRHKGFDVFVITQDATLLDHNIRKLAGRHVHYWRPLGMELATRWEFQKYTDVNDYHAKKTAIDRRVVKFPKQYYGKYKSSVEHTHTRRKLPRKLFLIPVAAVAIVVLATLALGVLSGVKDSLPGVSPVGVNPRENAASEIKHASSARPGRGVVPLYRVAGVVELGAMGYAILDNDGQFLRVPLSFCRQDYQGYSCEWEGRRFIESRLPVVESVTGEKIM